MLHLIIGFLFYFLPAIIGRNKRDATGILLLNLFLGWTGIGWIIALIWAITADSVAPMHFAPAGAGGRFCCQCGAIVYPGAHYCAGCGRAI